MTRLHFILGAAKSGKTAYGQACAEHQAVKQKGRLIYLATAQCYDAEMRDKISAHQEERKSHHWETIEEPLNIAPILEKLKPSDSILIDSIGMWVSNLLLAEQDIFDALIKLTNSLKKCPAHIVLIGDEVGWGIVPQYRLGRIFRDKNGHANQSLAQLCNQVDLVVAGLVQPLKS